LCKKLIACDKVDVIIITSGGVDRRTTMTIKVWPRHCDMISTEGMAQLLREKMNNGADVELTDAQIKMATLPPSSSKLRYPSDQTIGRSCSAKIFILPGVPQYFLPTRLKRGNLTCPAKCGALPRSRC
jgi:molybdopterin-biosynthesis enzyme MoeA-like protein